MTTRLLTGATGFVGGAIALELLDRTQDQLVALVRGQSADHARTRLHDGLTSMAVGYARPDLVPAILQRSTAVVGDITEAGCGVDLSSLPEIDEVWHCAASLRYEEKYRTEIEAQNIGGTANMLGLARNLGAGTVNYFSTAYVVGSRRGLVPEEPATDLEQTNNCYEESKVRAESLVRSAGEDVRIRILRPSIVIGHPVTRHGLNWSGMYGFARQTQVFRNIASRKLGTFLNHARVQLLAEPECPINLVPIDMVARNAVTVCLSDSPETYFHLVNSETIPVRDAVCEIMGLIGLREPRWVDDRDGFTSIDEALDDGMDFYRSYLRNGKQFGHGNTDAVCGAGASAAVIDRAEIAAYVGYFLRQQKGHAEDSGADRIVHLSASGASGAQL